MEDGILSPSTTRNKSHVNGGKHSQEHQDKHATHRRLLLTDPAAFRYLEEDPSTTVLERRRRLKGYELYFVEQWACSRKHPTFVITTYTGLDQHSVVGSVLSVPTDESAWSPRLRVYLTAIKRYHARAKETPLGTLMVTNLSNFPSALTVIHVPDGDLRNHREAFILNEDLKRLGCTGRAGLNLNTPNSATQAKFRELYRTSDQIPINASVVELVKLCQAALVLFGKLPVEYADGLLCDVTEQKIGDWWAEIGSDYMNIDPADGILGPTTVASILGLLMGARSRLHYVGVSIGKDVFDIVGTKRAISQFQKSQRMERTRRLDRQTLDRLHKVTAKHANSEIRVPRVVKSTVAELSGKGGSMVNAGKRAGIADVESFDIEDLVALGSGERFKWLWHGQPRKNEEKDTLSALDDELVFDDEQGAGRESRKRSADDDFSLRQTLSDRFYQVSHSSQNSLDHLPPDQALRRAALRNVAGKGAEAKGGLSRIRDAVSRRAHNHNYLRQAEILQDEGLKEFAPRDSAESHRKRTSESSFIDKSEDSASQSNSNSGNSSRRYSKMADERPHVWNREKPVDGKGTDGLHNRPSSSPEKTIDNDDSRMSGSVANLIQHASGVTSRQRAHRPTLDRDRTLTLGDMRAINKMEHFGWAAAKLSPLRSTKSFSTLLQKPQGRYWEQRFPRQTSFSAVVDVLSAGGLENETDRDNPATAIHQERVLAMQNESMGEKLYYIRSRESSWVEDKVRQVEDYDQQCSRTRVKMGEVYHRKLDGDHELHGYVDHLLAEKKTSINEAIKEVETLDAKLEYELQALHSKIEDVENGVEEFERQVIQLEVRAADLDRGPPEQISWIRKYLGMGIV